MLCSAGLGSKATWSKPVCILAKECGLSAVRLTKVLHRRNSIGATRTPIKICNESTGQLMEAMAYQLEPMAFGIYGDYTLFRFQKILSNN
jgi:hypothetical protein